MLDFSGRCIYAQKMKSCIYPNVSFKFSDFCTNPTKQHYYKAANFKNKKLGWEEPYNDLAGDGIMVTASYPIYDKNNNLLGVASHDVAT